MKVLVIGHSFIVDANRQLWNVLAQNGVTVDMVIPKCWRSNLISRISYSYNEVTDRDLNCVYALGTFFKGSGSFYFYNPFRLWWILVRNKYDGIILAQETWSLSLFQLRILRIFSGNKKTKLLLWVCQNIKKRFLYFMRFFERFNTSTVDIILGCCSEAKDVVRWKGISKVCKYFPFSFDSTAYKEVNRVVESDEIILGYMGRISEEKGIKLLIEAIELLREQKVKVRLVMAGAGPLVPYVREFLHIDYLGTIPHREAYKFYEKIDIFILPSQTRNFWKEQFGRVIIEAVASGKPVIGSTSGAIPEVMGKLSMPYLFTEDSVGELCAQVKKVLRDFASGKTYDIVKNAAIICEKLYSHRSVASRIQTYLTTDDRYDEI